MAGSVGHVHLENSGATAVVLAGGQGLRTTQPSLYDYQDADHARELLKRIWEVYGPYSATQLANMTHAPGTPWDRVSKRYGGKIPKRGL